MPTFYHGTARAAAIDMAGPAEANGAIDVTIGGGEFGRGFYTQDSKANAHSLAQNRPDTAQTACVLELTIDEGAYNGMSKRQLVLKRAIQLTKRLRRQRRTGTHLENVDVVIGPLNGSRFRNQQKFESENAQQILNGPVTQRVVI